MQPDRAGGGEPEGSRLTRCLRAIDRNGERWLLLTFYTLIVLTIAVEVIRRFALSYSSLWGEEAARYAFVYLAWIGCAVAVRDRCHIRIDFAVRLLPRRARAVANIFGDLMAVLLAVFALYWSIDPVLTSIRFGSVTHGLEISLAWFLVAVPFGFLLIMLRLVQSIRRDVSDLRHGRPVYEGEQIFD
ncbi:TRAP transporter small permease [Paralimibaculum aggregatum]|uniref:TRAP transporter small permease protein n=1 Tax=Paralimibaculum aggregatum TaxID=3036245 RepID=A0ABQ6LRY8_9RHOB|nr:TRAP transporter small permease [Limibaculum sp. NKW23]GMG84554.1 TRAP transporter small permease [Limibaculum sp. NKW23]